MKEEKFNYVEFIKGITKQIKEEIEIEKKENKLFDEDLFYKIIENNVQSELVYFDFIRDFEIIHELETIVSLDEEISNENKGISAYMNELAQALLYEYLATNIELDEKYIE